MDFISWKSRTDNAGRFLRDMLTDPIDEDMVESINTIGQRMGIKTIAEFAENDRIAGKLRAELTKR